MTAEDLARWNVGMLDQRLLAPASYREMQTEVRLNNGLGTSYGLGIEVRTERGHRVLAHGGEVSGFTASNLVFPDDRAAITVLVNQDSSDASGTIASRIAPLLFEKTDSAASSEVRARKILEGLQQGRLDRSLFTENANSYFTDQAIRDFAAGLAPLGAPAALTQTRQSVRGGMTFRLFEVKFSSRTLEIWERDMPDGKIEQYQVMSKE
jgi:CubicO group peptidase (beta-lactamase class C family)